MSPNTPLLGTDVSGNSRILAFGLSLNGLKGLRMILLMMTPMMWGRFESGLAMKLTNLTTLMNLTHLT